MVRTNRLFSKCSYSKCYPGLIIGNICLVV